MYRINFFDQVILPTAQTEDDLGTGTIDSGIVGVVGGGIDAYGNRVVLPAKRLVRVRGMYTRPGNWVDHDRNQLVDEGGNELIWADRNREIEDRIDSLKKLLGRKLPLWRRNEWGGERQYVDARLMSVIANRLVRNADNVLDVTATFETADAAWRETTQQSVAVSLAAAGTVAIEAANDGCEVLDATLTIVAQAAITSITLVGMGSDWTIAEALSSGQTLLIDCGAMAVTKNGVAAYSGFALNSGHSAIHWIVIGSEHSLWYLTTDGACDVTLRWYNQWL